MPVIQPSQIFISYSRVDSDFVDRLETDLRAHGHPTWVDRMRLEGGDDWAERIGHEIAQSGVMIVVLSPDAVASKWVRREITVADERNMPIFPVLFKAVSRVPLQIAERQYIDFTTGYDKALRALLLALAATNQRHERTTVADVPSTAPRTPVIVPKIKDAIPGDLVKPHPVPIPSTLNHPTSDPTVDMPSEGASSLQPSTRQPLSRRRFIIGGASVAAVATVAAVGIRNQSPPTKPAPAATKTPAVAPTIAAQQTAEAKQAILSQHHDFTHSNSYQATSVAWSPDNKRIVSASNAGAIQSWNSTDGSNPLIYSLYGSVSSVAWSPTGKRIASANVSNTVNVWDAVDGSNVLTYNSSSFAGDVVNCVAWSPTHNSQRIASAHYNKNVQVWNAVDGSGVYVYTGHSGIVNGVAWSPDGQRIASASFDSTVQVWNAADGSDVYTYPGHSLGVSSVAWSPNGDRIVSASKDKTVQIWNATDGSHPITCTGHSLGVNSVVWAPDGKHIASASNDGTVRVWDATNGSSVFIYPGHLDAVNSMAWSPDGKHIASASSDSTVQVWHL